ncbi:hypothetical protein FRB99_002127 [Tulasnella sp. 403]|nr:hypothetical protein FRB99_002127 [Tulasnella sp. 403]
MAPRQAAYPFSGPNASTSSSVAQSRFQHQQPLTQPSPPASLHHNALSQQQQRRPFPAPPTPGASPNASQASLLLPPSQRQQAGPNSNATLNVPSPRGGQPLKSKNSDTSLRSAQSSFGQSISDKYSLGTDPSFWGADLAINTPEPDDHIHNPDPRRDRKNDKGGTIFTARGIANLGCLLILALGLVTLFAGFPLITYFTQHPLTTLGGYNLGGINSSGQVPSMTGNWALIDKDTPQEAYTYTSYQDGSTLELVFSDEFNVDGRSFLPGDDPYWEAVDLHYWGTNNLEWYDPEQMTTKNGSLVITLDKIPNHGLQYKGGMMTTWNKFCFTGGLILVNALLPGSNSVQGLWPAAWTMGNLGRAGFGASLDGMWPYSYDSCDVGTLPNQTMPDGTPPAAASGGYDGQPLSYLPGQRLSACTCQGEIHPGPVRTDGTFVGRSAPEIDILEAQVAATGTGHVSQSAQFAPFNAHYKWDNSSTNAIFHMSKFELNSYRGGQYQMTTSGIGDVNQQCYELTGGCYDIYGFEYAPGATGFITWVSEGQASWTVMGTGLGPDPLTQIGQRTIPEEPLYVILNLGMSENFGDVDFDHLTFPSHFEIDWVRVYQPKDAVNVGCDPDGFPTTEYINMYPDAYTNPNLTVSGAIHLRRL